MIEKIPRGIFLFSPSQYFHCRSIMNEKIIAFNATQRTKKVPELRSGDVVRVHRKIREGDKDRTQIFEGMIIAIQGRQSSSPMLTVRKVSDGVGVEITIPLHSPLIEKIEHVKRASVRRAKLYYIREKSAKSLRLKYKDLAEFAVEEKRGVPTVKTEKAEEEVGEKEMGKEPVEEKKEKEVRAQKEEESSPKEKELSEKEKK